MKGRGKAAKTALSGLRYSLSHLSIAPLSLSQPLPDPLLITLDSLVSPFAALPHPILFFTAWMSEGIGNCIGAWYTPFGYKELGSMCGKAGKEKNRVIQGP
jgi:hypothetical protein